MDLVFDLFTKGHRSENVDPYFWPAKGKYYDIKKIIINNCFLIKVKIIFCVMFPCCKKKKKKKKIYLLLDVHMLSKKKLFAILIWSPIVWFDALWLGNYWDIEEYPT